MPKSMKDVVLICGSRDIKDINISMYLNPAEIGCVVSGGASGVDTIAEQWAKSNKIEFVVYLPQYKLYGKGAPLKRDEEMVEFCDRVVAFWNGKSRGTKYTIDYAKKLNKLVDIHIIESLD